MLLVSILVAVALCQLLALLAWPWFTDNARQRVVVIIIVALVVLWLPAIVPTGHPGSPLTRFIVAVTAMLLVWKLVDLHLGYRIHGRPPVRRYLWFHLPGLGNFVYRRVGVEAGPDRRGNWQRVARGVAESCLGAAALVWLFSVEWGSGAAWFTVEHCAKWTAAYFLLNGGLLVIVAVTRLAGFHATDIYRDPIISRTPGEFWRRYNRPVGEFLFVDIYRHGPWRGHPLRATLVVFAVSGLVHEYIFGVALLKVTGYQMTFFMAHGVAVALTARWRPTGIPAVAGWLLTIAFLLATLVIFMGSAADTLDPLLQFYRHGRPAMWAD